jgi:hypothetical protein
MPIRRRRHFVTETDDLAEALDEAAHRWPDLSRAQLLLHAVTADPEDWQGARIPDVHYSSENCRHAGSGSAPAKCRSTPALRR